MGCVLKVDCKGKAAGYQTTLLMRLSHRTEVAWRGCSATAIGRGGERIMPQSPPRRAATGHNFGPCNAPAAGGASYGRATTLAPPTTSPVTGCIGSSTLVVTTLRLAQDELL